MSELSIVTFCLISLYFSQRILLAQFGKLTHQLGGNRNSLIILWSIVFLPGTIIHELSHFFVAIITGARTGKIEIFPRFLEEEFENEERGSKVTLGYVQTQKLNPIQGILVGLAPFVVGLGLLIWLSSSIQISYDSQSFYVLLAQCYLFFTISNSFFPSASDLRHVIPFSVVLVATILILWLIGFKFFISPGEKFFLAIDSISRILLLSTFLNILISVLFLFLNKLFSHGNKILNKFF